MLTNKKGVGEQLAHPQTQPLQLSHLEQTHANRQTDRLADRQTDRQINGMSHRCTQYTSDANRLTRSYTASQTQRERERDRRTDGQTDRQTDRLINGMSHRCTQTQAMITGLPDHKQPDRQRQTYIQTDRPTDERTDRQTDRQMLTLRSSAPARHHPRDSYRCSMEM